MSTGDICFEFGRHFPWVSKPGWFHHLLLLAQNNPSRNLGLWEQASDQESLTRGREGSVLCIIVGLGKVGKLISYFNLHQKVLDKFYSFYTDYMLLKSY